MKKVYLFTIIIMATSLMYSFVFINNCRAQIINGNNFEAQYTKLVAQHQLKFPNLTQQLYASGKNQLLWFNTKPNLIWKVYGLLNNAGQYGLKSTDFHCDQLTAGLLNDLLLTKSVTDYKITADMMMTDALLNFINQLHYGKANPNFPLKNLDHDLSKGMKATDVLLKAIESNDFETELLKVQPGFEGYRQLQQYLKLMVAQYTGDCYESSEETEKLIAINLERWRWFNGIAIANTYLLVNIPSFELQFHHRYETATFKAILGQPITPIPIRVGHISAIQISPRWVVPKNRVIKEILPHAFKNPAYLPSNHFLIYDRNKKIIQPNLSNLKLVQNNNSEYTVVQKPGENNMLPRIVLYTGNQNGIKIRDIPDTKLFQNPNSTITKGCIMIENPESLIGLLLAQDSSSSQMASVQSAVHSYSNKTVSLKHQIPVFLGYFTCDLKDGILNTYRDIYSLDKKLLENM